jgi:hypothetical protein
VYQVPLPSPGIFGYRCRIHHIHPRITPNPPNITIYSLETHSRIYACYDATWFPVYFLGLVIQLLFHCALPPVYPSRPSTSAGPWPRSQFVPGRCSATAHLYLISVGHQGHGLVHTRQPRVILITTFETNSRRVPPRAYSANSGPLYSIQSHVRATPRGVTPYTHSFFPLKKKSHLLELFT